VTSSAEFEVLAIGETMAMIAPALPGPLAGATELRLDIGGAESNVAMHLAGLGHTVAWASRVGDDPFGHRILQSISAAEVDVSMVTVDPDAATGLYFKDPAETGTQVFYYRANSAASAMNVDWLTGVRIASARIVHVSGITPALSESCALLLGTILSTAHANGVLVSFDVNYRAPLWSVATAAPVLRELAEQSDIVFVGRDEAEQLWGAQTATDIRRLLPGPARLIVKDAEVGATEFFGTDETFVASAEVAVIEPVGAGDAFAAGYLSALLSDTGSHLAIERGHALAAIALGSMLDVPRRS
jgi:2-dehydro-3-deoxygluconokinase